MLPGGPEVPPCPCFLFQPNVSLDRWFPESESLSMIFTILLIFSLLYPPTQKAKVFETVDECVRVFKSERNWGILQRVPPTSVVQASAVGLRDR
jgi:hypothetical protein